MEKGYIFGRTVHITMANYKKTKLVTKMDTISAKILYIGVAYAIIEFKGKAWRKE
jgi:hypothetical protein